jgi:hypothetical protein
MFFCQGAVHAQVIRCLRGCFWGILLFLGQAVRESVDKSCSRRD